jgi:hypothetical protein
MVRSSMFLRVNPEREIYVSRTATQNIQILLPVAHACESIQMEKPLAFYLVRSGSRSRISTNSLEGIFKWDSEMWEITRQTLLRMRDVDESFIKNVSHLFIRNKLLPAAFRARLKRESLGLLSNSGLGMPKKAMCKWMIYIRCSKLSGFLDLFSLRCWTRVLNRVFWVIVRSNLVSLKQNMINQTPGVGKSLRA